MVMDLINETLTRGVYEIYPDKNALRTELEKRKFTLYQGFDPSMPSLHLGNLVGVMKLRQFQKLGHKVIFLIGDFTGMIGDPTDKTAVRKQLSREEVSANAQAWKEQLKNLLYFEGDNPVEIKYNSEWNDRITFRDLIGITSHITVQQMIERDMYQVRLKEGKPIYLHEFLYPVAQGYDSVAMDVDMEIGGSDQTFNMLAGRSLMKDMSGKEKYVLTTKLLVDKEGKKVGKTTGNALFLSSGPKDFYGGIMSFPDEVIALAFELLTETDLNGIDEKVKKDPLNEKKRLAFEIVNLVWGENDANEAQKYFEETVQKKDLSDVQVNLETIYLKTELPVISVLTENGLVQSRSDFKRLVEQKAIEIDGIILDDISTELKGGEVVKVGKKKTVKIVKE